MTRNAWAALVQLILAGMRLFSGRLLALQLEQHVSRTLSVPSACAGV